ncbi:hypothetical protein H072_9524 [Dactylellina haptotyla CBS 200.50]|uniref:Uncharacterized protein n=1 Tax=Dactylellina haptotyla (strain CBS 200.50) TaxID=1284197 RepID=S8BCJ0_DACHA|nr:hypothetical protein H072_9524 [Dactylellina haptotyla CBS 200.50]
MLKSGKLDCKEFLRPRQEFLRASLSKPRPWLARPIYHNVQFVLEHLGRSSEPVERNRLQNIKDLLEKMAKLDNHTTFISAAIDEIFGIMQKQQASLERKLSSLRKQQIHNERLIDELKKTYDSSWKSLRSDLKAQQDVLAIEEELRLTFLKELKIICERHGATPHNHIWWKASNTREKFSYS